MEDQKQEKTVDTKDNRDNKFTDANLDVITEEGSINIESESGRDTSLIKRTRQMTQDAIYNKRDPEEEFFMLSVLSLKMIHTEEYDNCDYIYKVNSNGFWKEVKD